MYELTSSVLSATKTLIAPSVSSGGYVSNTRNLQADVHTIIIPGSVTFWIFELKRKSTKIDFADENGQ